jgi:8-oxo-dGTP pyrophosphatase MutT (NUDIX family)
MHSVAVGFLQLPNGKLVCQIRSNIPNIAAPGSISSFGGGVESGETYEEALIREFKEELDIDITSYGYVNIGKLDYFSDFKKVPAQQSIYFIKIPNIDILNLKEGVGIALIDPNTDSSHIYMSETGKKVWKIMQEYLATQLT